MMRRLQPAPCPAACDTVLFRSPVRLTTVRTARTSRRKAYGLSVRATATPRQKERLERSQSLEQAASHLEARPLTAGAPAWVSNPTFFLACLGGFLGITTDLYAPWGKRLLVPGVDEPVQSWVVDHIPYFVRETVCDDVISNISITLGCAGWAFCTAFLLYASSESLITGRASFAALLSKGGNLQRLGLAWLAYITAGGSFIPGDNALIGTLKHTFVRVRPSAGHHTFSFPSGHCAAVTFTVGMLLFALLPWCFEWAEERRRLENRASDDSVSEAQGFKRFSQSVVQNGGKLWAVAVFSTILGRIFGNAHWLSDTLAGASLSGALVSGFLILCQKLERAESAQ